MVGVVCVPLYPCVSRMAADRDDFFCDLACSREVWGSFC